MLGLLMTLALSINVPPPLCQIQGGDGHLVMYSYPHQEVIDVTYRQADGSLDPDALRQISHLMRSPDDAETTINPYLVQLLDQIQDHFGADTVEVISGYRSPQYNAQLKAEGHAVARESFHLKGQATDLHLDEITEEAMRDYIAGLRCGGVGFYPRLHFVHVDLGPKRQWGEVRGKRQLVGEQPIAWQTDKNYYQAGDTVRWVADVPLVLEHFARGKWNAVQQVKPNSNMLRLTTKLRYGKYRLVSRSEPVQYSNEFYFKKM